MTLLTELFDFIDGRIGPEGSADLARRVFDYQCDRFPEYARYARGKAILTLSDLPGVPETAYKHNASRGNGSTVRTFRSSGTTGLRTVINLSEEGLALMDSAILAGARRHLFADGLRVAVHLLVPTVAEAPDMIMAYGMALIAKSFGQGDASYPISGGKLDSASLRLSLESAVSDSQPVLLAGGSFVIASFLEDCVGHGWRVALPPGSRILDAGGFKRSGREIQPWELQKSIEDVLGIPLDAQRNLLGMTELASQFYDSGDSSPNGLRVKVNSPWTATTVIDPENGEHAHAEGVLKHVDLAIYDRPCAILTADIGFEFGDGFCFVRRASAVTRKGCALAG